MYYQTIRVLYVEDDPTDRLAMQDYSWILGWDLELRASVQEGLERISTQSYKLVIVGAVEPACSIVQLTRAVSDSSSADSKTPVLLLTDQHHKPAQDGQPFKARDGVTTETKPLLLSRLKTLARQLIES